MGSGVRSPLEALLFAAFLADRWTCRSWAQRIFNNAYLYGHTKSRRFQPVNSYIAEN